jgi:hypothetical protein
VIEIGGFHDLRVLSTAQEIKKGFDLDLVHIFFPFWIVCNAISPFAMAYFNTRHTSSHMNDSEFIKIGVKLQDNRIFNFFLLKEETR